MQDAFRYYPRLMRVYGFALAHLRHLVLVLALVVLATPDAQAGCTTILPSCFSCLMGGGTAAKENQSRCQDCGHIRLPALMDEEEAKVLEQSLGGPDYAVVEDNLVHYVVDAPPVAPELASGMKIGLDEILEIADEHPGAALALLRFHPEYRWPEANMLRGNATSVGIPTKRSVVLTIARATEAELIEALMPLEAPTYYRMSWVADDPQAAVLRITFTSELVSDRAPSAAGEVLLPQTIVTVSKKHRRVLSVVHSTLSSK